MAPGSTRIVVAALVGNAAIAAAKYVAAAVSGSSAMFAQAVHSTVDAVGQMLLLVGLHRAARPSDAAHSLGHGREVHFWASVVAILLFGIGAGVSIHAGFRALLDPQPIARAGWSYAVLAVAALFEAAVWLAAWRGLDGAGAGRPVLRTLRQSGDPARFTVLFDATVALLGLAVAFVGVFCAARLGWLRADAVAALVTGAILAAAALALAIETRGLLIGEAASPDLVEDILGLAGRAAFVEGVNEVRTVHFGPADVLVNISVDARDSLSAGEVETGVTALESEIRAQHPEVGRVFIEIQSAFAGGGPASGSDPGRRPDP